MKFSCYCQNNSFLVGIYEQKVILRDNFENRKYQKMFRKYEILIGEKIKIVTKKPALHGTITKTGWNFFTTTVFCSKLEVNPESAFQSGFIRL